MIMRIYLQGPRPKISAFLLRLPFEIWRQRRDTSWTRRDPPAKRRRLL